MSAFCFAPQTGPMRNLGRAVADREHLRRGDESLRELVGNLFEPMTRLVDVHH
jgi:hypothetical protein